MDSVLGALLGIRPRVPAPSVATQSTITPLAGPTTATAMTGATTEHERAGLLTDGARQTLSAAGSAISHVARAVAPSLHRAAERLRGGLSPENQPSQPAPREVDPLEEDRRALEARFEQLEREWKDK